MDSLTQIILGAACGEIALGKKIGNKALLFGAIGGTIPDLDVFIGRFLYGNEIQAMAFHRGFMHSILFAVLGSFLFGLITYKLYNSGIRKETTSLHNWIWLFFLSIFTHPLLDCFTPYGTQLFTPFSNYRVAFNTISVVDPLYTIPFLLSLIIMMFFNRNRTRRTWCLKTGIYLSSAYMIFTIFNKIYMDSVFKKSFEKANININRFSAQPTIFNNILWYSVAETDTKYHLTYYSLFDKSTTADKIISVEKNHDLIDLNNRNLKTLTWFSNNYFNISKSEKIGTYKYTDLRYPLLDPEDANSSLFNFTIYNKNNQWDILPFDRTPPKKEAFNKFIDRFWGI
ncbi:metal-dependent hydrolase [uncultured Polaribacter sp.]|uniref:metal-dependent hydrolase n=1 Tax=uncultured Polaribacter sp. TaxID=174711 RepID=UPI0026237E28|nr:metal-dependent hydrolase [uncultured Polaribacter sp.]